jgi:hypothetical protein
MKHLCRKIYLKVVPLVLLSMFFPNLRAHDGEEQIAYLEGEIVKVSAPLAEILSELGDFIEQENAKELASTALLKVIGELKLQKRTVSRTDFGKALPEIISYIQHKIELESTRSDVTSGGGDGTTAPLTCDLGTIVRLLNELAENINGCCEIIEVDLQQTSSLVMEIALTLESTLTSLMSIEGTFSTIEALTQQLVSTVSLLEETITDFAFTTSTLTETLEGTFTAINACCEFLSQEFINTNTLLLSEFSGTYSALEEGFSGVGSEFQSTWSQLTDLVENSCGCLPQFQTTWTLLQLLDGNCGCISQFQQTWTILNSLMITLSGGCDCTPQFNQTWAMLAEGFNENFINFQGTYTAIDSGFQGTYSLLDAINCGYISLFNEKEQSSRLDWIDTKFNYGVSSYDTTTSTFGGGFVTSFTSMALVETGTGSSGFAQIQSKSAIRYRAGHETYAIFSAQFSNGGAATSTQWIGLFDSQDGFAVGFSNTSFALLYRNAGTNTIVLQGSFNIDNLDGTGPSGFTLNPIRLNLFRIAFGWLGASSIKFQILNEQGRWITFHEIERNNQFFVPNVRNPYLPLTAQVNKSGGATSLQIGTAGWNGGIIGEPSNASSRYFSVVAANNSSVSTETHLLTIRNKDVFQGRTNRIAIRVSFLNVGSSHTSNKTTVVRLYKNATVTGLSFSDVNAANSVTQSSTAGTYIIGTGTYLLSFLTVEDNPTYVIPLQQDEINLILEPGESATFTSQRLIGSTNTFFFALVSWEELF